MPKHSATLWLPGMSPDAPLYTPLSLERYFLDSFLPASQEKRLSKDRIGELQQAVHRYVWWCQSKDRIINPVLTDVTAGRLAAFRKDVLNQPIPGRDGKIRLCSPRSLNKTLQALEQIVAAAIEDQTLDESRGLVRVRKCQHPRQIGKVVIPDESLAGLLKACDKATWPQRSIDGRALDAPLLWRTAIVIFTNFGMRTQDLLCYESHLSPIRWPCLIPAGQSPAEDGTAESSHGWLHWLPNKTRNRKMFPMTLPLNQTVSTMLRQWRESQRPAEHDPVFPIPYSSDGLYQQWRRILSAAGVAPKPKRTFEADGRLTVTKRTYLLKHLRCTAGTRAEEHGAAMGHAGIGRWVTGHISNDVFERHYRAHERALMQVIETLPQPEGFDPNPKPVAPTLRIVG